MEHALRTIYDSKQSSVLIIMYAIKGGWIGQTFALATCNESGGRKARIRRSKEERKAMVESFIKTYQISNDGKFPSLNLTHKEVGGSFYTVREIVRDIIQENRVLGPAKFNSDIQRFDGNARESLRESATMESRDYLFQLETENTAVLDQNASAFVEMNMNGNAQYAKHQAGDAGEFGSTAIEESDKLVYMDALMTVSAGNNKETELESHSADYHGNTSMEIGFQGFKQLDKHEDLNAEQLVYGSPVEEYDGVVSTESSVSQSFIVEQEAELEVTGSSEKTKTEIKLNDNEETTKLDKHDDLDVEQLVYGSPIEEYDEVVSTESSASESFVVEQEPELEVTACSENASLEIKLNDNEEKTKHEDIDFGKYVNGSQVEESNKLDCLESSLIEKHEMGRSSELVEAKTNKLSPTENIVVETFPLRPVAEGIYTVETASKANDLRDLNRELEKLEGNCVNSGNGGVVMDRMEPVDTSVNASEPVVQKAVNDSQASSSNGRPVMVHETTSKNASDLMEINVSLITADIGTQNHNKPITASHVKSASLKTVDGSEEIIGAKARDDKSVFPNNSYGVKSANSMELKAEKPVMVGSENETPKENQALKESKPTLDRINLESWEGASKKSLQERNPLFIFLKALVSAFMKESGSCGIL
ncbi:hypothetical protein V2J09_008360 [Rumex salicifolius]